MAKISQLPITPPDTLNGDELLPVVQNGGTKSARLRDILAKVFAPVPTSGASKAIASSARLVSSIIDSDGRLITPRARAQVLQIGRSLSTAALQIGCVIMERRKVGSTDRVTADAKGRIAVSIGRDGSQVIPRLRRGNGREVYPQIDDALARVKALENTQARRLPASVERLRRLYYDAPGVVRTANPIVPVTCAYGSDGAVSLLSNPITYMRDHPLILRKGGGIWYPGSSTPGGALMYQRNNRYGVDLAEVGSTNITEIVISAEVTQFELVANGLGYIYMLIDGVWTGEVIVPSPAVTAGGARNHLFTLPASTRPRRITLFAQGGQGMGGIRLNGNQGGRLLDPRTPMRGYPAFIGAVGDSITEGSAASHIAFNAWFPQACMRLGASDWQNMGVGSSGYLKSIAGRERFRVRWPNILTGNNGGPPDLLIVAGGINDDPADIPGLRAAAYEFFDGIRNGVPAGKAGDGTQGPIPAIDLPGTLTMPIVVLGPFYAYNGNQGGSQNAKRDAIFEEAAKFRHIHTVDVTSWWSDPATYQPWYNPSADTTHPITLGHHAMGKLAADAILPILKNL